MATRKTTIIPNLKVRNLPNPLKAFDLRKIKSLLAITFYLIWIIIGIFFLIIIYGQIKQGALSSIFGKSSQTQQASQQPQADIPTETTLPGVGKVNIECVQNSLDSSAIQKLITEGNTSTLTAEEKSKLDPCIVEKESPPPSPATSPGK